MRAVTLLLLVAACRPERLDSTTVGVRLLPLQVDFERVPLGATERREVTVLNDGRSPVQARLLSQGDGLALEGSGERALEPGRNSLWLTFSPVRLGRAQGTVTVLSLGSQEQASLAWQGEGVSPPRCEVPGPCARSAFDTEARACRVEPLADGTACDSGDVCIIDGTCQLGRCVGVPVRCDDGNACTTDVCESGSGCRSDAAPPCPGDGACGVGRCDPLRGCGLAPADDGTPCGPARGCAVADVCVNGSCTQRRPPDGFVCAEASPCQGAGRCENALCLRPSLGPPLQPLWSVGEPTLDGGVPAEAWADVFADGDGGFVLSSYFMTAPRLKAQLSTSVSLPNGARRCIAWRGRVVCADHPSVDAVANVSALDATTGAPVWRYDRAGLDLPVLVGPRQQTFLARLVVLGEERLAMVFEAQTLGSNIDRCRRFGVVVVDWQGQTRAVRTVDHPSFLECNHPHSYGAAADVQGNLYLSFTPSVVDNPAQPQPGSTGWLVSYAPSLAERWNVKTEGLGGELAVARGVLAVQYENVLRDTATGQARASGLRDMFGLGAVSRTHVIHTRGPQLRPTGLNAEPVNQGARWQWSSASGATVASAPVMVSLETSAGRRSAVLVVTSELDAGSSLVALDVLTGSELFVCPMAVQRAALVEAGQGEIAVMSEVRASTPEASTCEVCDPRWARTRARFGIFQAAGVRPSDEPWPGPWGGDGHDHRESPGR